MRYICFSITYLLISCSVSEIPRSSTYTDALVAELSISIFTEHVHPELVNSVCSSCHSSSAKKEQYPPFADQDASKAHQVIMRENKVDFNNIPKSRLVTKKHNCGDDCDATAEKFLQAITTWKNKLTVALQASKRDGDTLVTVPFDLKNNSSLRYEIGSLIDKEYGGGAIMMDVAVAPLTQGEGYALTDIQIKTYKHPVFIKGIKSLINGLPDSRNSSLSRIGCAIKPPESQIIEGSATVSVDDINAENLISFEFEELRIAKAQDELCDGSGVVGQEKDDSDSESTPGGDQLAAKRNEFDNTIVGIINRTCSGRGCHGGNGGTQQSYSTFDAAWTGRGRIIERVENNTMPIGGRQFAGNERQTLLDWLQDP